MSHHLIDSDFLTISVIFTVSPSQVIFHVLLYEWFPLSHYLSDFLVSPPQRFFLSHHLSHFNCFTISVISTISSSQLIPMCHHLRDFLCFTIWVIFIVSLSQQFSVSHHLHDYLSVSGQNGICRYVSSLAYLNKLKSSILVYFNALKCTKIRDCN